MSRGRLSAVLPALYPLSMILGLIAVPAGSVLLRLGLIVATAPGLLRTTKIGPTHRRWFAVLGAYLAAVTLSSLAADSPSLALADLQRQVFLVAVAIALSLALTDRRSRTAFALAAVPLAATSTLIILSLYGRFAGIPVLGPVQESFKTYAANTFDVPVNAVSFVAVLAAVLAVPSLVRWPATLLLVLLPVAVAVAASGSRTTAVSLIAAVPLTALVLVLHRPRRLPIWVPYGAISVIAGWASLTFADQLGRLAVSPALSELTTGRSALWAAAWGKFLERPLFGWGSGSFPIELGRFLPATEAFQAADLRILSTSGGAHNALLSVLAERGVIAASAAALVCVFLLLVALRVYRARHRLDGLDRAFGWLAPFVVVLILARSLGELPGWFGYADSLVDFLAYGWAAMLVAVAASLDPGAEPTGSRQRARFGSA
jgi:O-antigen ligase